MELHNRDKKSGRFMDKLKCKWENDAAVIRKMTNLKEMRELS